MGISYLSEVGNTSQTKFSGKNVTRKQKKFSTMVSDILYKASMDASPPFGIK